MSELKSVSQIHFSPSPSVRIYENSEQLVDQNKNYLNKVKEAKWYYRICVIGSTSNNLRGCCEGKCDLCKCKCEPISSCLRKMCFASEGKSLFSAFENRLVNVFYFLAQAVGFSTYATRNYVEDPDNEVSSIARFFDGAMGLALAIGATFGQFIRFFEGYYLSQKIELQGIKVAMAWNSIKNQINEKNFENMTKKEFIKLEQDLSNLLDNMKFSGCLDYGERTIFAVGTITFIAVLYGSFVLYGQGDFLWASTLLAGNGFLQTTLSSFTKEHAEKKFHALAVICGDLANRGIIQIETQTEEVDLITRNSDSISNKTSNQLSKLQTEEYNEEDENKEDIDSNKSSSQIVYVSAKQFEAIKQLQQFVLGDKVKSE